MALHPDPWLSAVLARPVFAVTLPPAASEAQLAARCRQLEQHARQQAAALYFAKVDTTAVAAVRALSRLGFFVVDVNLTLAVTRERWLHLPADGGCVVQEAAAEHHAALLHIAETCFRYSRFHLDPLLPPALAHRLKRCWVQSYCEGKRGERLFVALAAGQPVGFLAALRAAPHTGVIDLVGVHPAHQRRGVGQALVRHALAYYRDTCSEVQVGTQAANIPSVRLYERLGFTLVRSAYVMHWHV
ncbi:MAG: hypothetical protein KatS3mg131_1316 [Candidatus Tectimicrobiota bacterium]|nr:MAG: hypothetical protein KatS3mg131_1316 [Candidatus Tectomicrobia bacterium]